MKLVNLSFLVIIVSTLFVFSSCEEKTPQNDNTKLWPAYNAGTEKVGYINAKGKWAIDAMYDGAATFSCGLAAVLMGDSEGFVDKKGKFKALAGKEAYYSHFYNDLLVATEEDGEKLGYVTTDMEWELYPMYEQASNFMGGLAAVSTDGDKIGFINKQGDMKIAATYHSVGNFSEGLARARATSGGKYGFINTTGDYVIQPMYEACSDFSDGLAVYITENEKFGYINKKGDVVIQAVYEYADIFWESGLAPVSLDGEKYGFINKKGDIKIQPMYDDAYPFREGLALVVTDNKIGFINTKGDYVIQPMYDEVESTYFHNGLMLVAQDDNDGGGTISYIDKKGKLVYSWEASDQGYNAPAQQAPAKTRTTFSKRDTNYTIGKMK